jgi:hypothetical protein
LKAGAHVPSICHATTSKITQQEGQVFILHFSALLCEE